MTWDRSLRGEVAAEFRAASLLRRGIRKGSDEAPPLTTTPPPPAISRPRRLITPRSTETP